MTSEEREFDIVVWGASGFTGRLVAEYLLGRYGTGAFRWALGGRSRSKLEEVRQQIERETETDARDLRIVLGDATNQDSMTALAERARVVCTTVGPYALYGTELVAACARAGTHYCDLTGEVQWIRRMIDAHQDHAGASGARIVFTCGFDSVPSDLGVFFLQREMNARHGVACSRIKCRVEGFSGGFSGGTIASIMNMMEEARRDPEVMRLNADPYGLNPKDQRTGPDQGEPLVPVWDPDFAQWTGPFVMAGLNGKVVRRTNALLGYAYGPDFRYDEAMLTGDGPIGFTKALGLTAATGGALSLLRVTPLRRLIARRLPSPGEGPSREAREAGYWDLRFLGEHPDDPGKSLHARMTGDRDPGYGSTAKMLGEAAVSLAIDPLSSSAGFLTPAAAMGEALLARLQDNAGVSATIEEG